jgi:hypothetical protein
MVRARLARFAEFASYELSVLSVRILRTRVLLDTDTRIADTSRLQGSPEQFWESAGHHDAERQMIRKVADYFGVDVSVLAANF